MYKLKDVTPAADEKIYSIDVSSKGAKQFIAKTLPAMWRLMQEGPKYYCEIIQDRPCHLYFDFDEGDVKEEWKKLKKMLNKVFKALKDQVGTIRYEYLDASANGKQSAHVIVVADKYLLQSPVQGRAFLYRLKEMFGELPAIDDKIYTRNRCFRMLGSSKYGQNRPFIQPGSTWNMQNWVKTLVQPVQSLEAVNLGLGEVVPAPMRNREVPPCVEKVLEWAGASHYRWKNDLEWVWGGHLVKGKCAIAGRTHRKNNRYFIYKAPDSFTIGCHHCKQRINVVVPEELEAGVQNFLQRVIRY